MVSLWQIFTIFTKIGAFTIGGGPAMLPIIQREMVGRGWMNQDEFTDITTLAQTAPGLLAVNISIFAGYKLRGVKGSIVATLGSILPSFISILIIAMVFSEFKDNPVVLRAFKGIRPVVVALIAVPMIDMARKANKKWWTWILTGITIGLVAFMKVSPIYILITVIAAGWAIAASKRNRQKKDDDIS